MTRASTISRTTERIARRASVGAALSSALLGLIAGTAALSCARTRQSDPPTTTDRCPPEGSLAVLLVYDGDPAPLVGELADSDSYVLLSQRYPPGLASVSHTGTHLANTFWTIHPRDKDTIFPLGDREVGLAIGPYAGPIDELSMTCHTDWCGEKDPGHFYVASVSWKRTYTIHRQGSPWLEIFEVGDESGARTELRTAQSCETKVIGATGEVGADDWCSL